MPCKTFIYKKRKSIGIKIPPRPCKNSVSREPITENNFRPLFYVGEEAENYEPFEPLINKTEKSPLKLLREWVQKQRFIPQDLRDEFLLLFLSAESCLVDAAIAKLQKYFQSRQEPSYLFRNRDPLSPENAEIFKKLYVLPLSYTTYDGCHIILTGLFGPTRYNQMEHAKALAMVFDLLIWENGFGYGDFVVVLDGRHFRCPQMLENKVCNHRSITSLLLDTIPGTLRSFYLLHPPCYIKNVADSRDGIWFKIAQNTEELVKYIPSDILPLEYGGNLGNLKNLIEKWQLHMNKNRNFFVNFEKQMIHNRCRRLCHEKEMAEGGKSWIYRMRLEEDEWEYKIRYYQKMRDYRPLKHPAYGAQRLLNRKKPKQWKDPFGKCRKQAKQEKKEETKWNASREFTPKTQETKLDPENCEPILELHIHYLQ